MRTHKNNINKFKLMRSHKLSQRKKKDSTKTQGKSLAKMYRPHIYLFALYDNGVNL